MNQTLFLFLNSFAGKSMGVDDVIIFIADLLPYLMIIFAGIFLVLHFKIFKSFNNFLLLKKKWKEIIFVPVSASIAWFFSFVLKILIQEPRPFRVLETATPLITETGFSFPSGHATFFMALAVAIFFLNKKTGYIFILSALLIGIARIFAGIHYPLDIFSGFILGFMVVWIFKIFFKNSY